MIQAEKIIVRLVVSSKSLSSDTIANLSGIKFDRKWKEGDKVPIGQVRYKENGCLLESGLSQDRPLEEQLERLFQRIDQHFDGLRRLAKDCTVEVVCIVYFYTANTSLRISAADIDRFSRIGAAIVFDLYGLAEK